MLRKSFSTNKRVNLRKQFEEDPSSEVALKLLELDPKGDLGEMGLNYLVDNTPDLKGFNPDFEQLKNCLADYNQNPSSETAAKATTLFRTFGITVGKCSKIIDDLDFSQDSSERAFWALYSQKQFDILAQKIPESGPFPLISDSPWLNSEGGFYISGPEELSQSFNEFAYNLANYCGNTPKYICNLDICNMPGENGPTEYVDGVHIKALQM